ncbi:MAG: hypothetical protein F6K37_33055 [Moorea sp. SIO4E2]|nr:hypothetical protein [Moorena sp. SIO4E2]NEQ10576.1 hypothetical protein [Moorena sp. SIO4E2]
MAKAIIPQLCNAKILIILTELAKQSCLPIPDSLFPVPFAIKNPRQLLFI